MGTVQNLAIQNVETPTLDHLDVVCPEFLSYMSPVRAQHLVLSGFQGHYAKEAIDKAKYCASYAEYVQCICFVTDGLTQFEAVLENGRGLPKTAQNVCISMATRYGRVVSGYDVGRIIERNCFTLRRITSDGEIYVDIELLSSVRVMDVLSTVKCFFEARSCT